MIASSSAIRTVAGPGVEAGTSGAGAEHAVEQPVLLAL